MVFHSLEIMISTFNSTLGIFYCIQHFLYISAHDLLTANVTRHVSIDVLIWMEKYGLERYAMHVYYS